MQDTPRSDASHAASHARRWQVITAGICALVLTVGLARFAYTPMLPLMAAQAGLSAGEGGWLAALNYAGYISGALLAASIGSLSLKFRLYRIGLWLGVISVAAMASTTALLPWLFWRYVAGLASTAGLLIASGLVLNWLVRHRYRGQLGLHFMGLGLGIVVSGVAVEVMTRWGWHWDGQWLGLAGLGLMLLVPAWCWLPPPAPVVAGAAIEAPAVNQAWLGRVTLAYACAGFGYVISATFIVAIIVHLPGLGGQGNRVWALLGLAAMPSSFIWDGVTRRLGEIPALIAAFGLQIVSIICSTVSTGLWGSLLGALLFGVTFVGIVSMTLALIGRRYPANPAKAMARLTLGYGVAQIVAPVIAGQLAARSGDYDAVLWMAAGIMLIGMALLATLRADDSVVTNKSQYDN